MDFWSIYESRQTVSTFGSQRFLLNTGERYNTSLASVKEKSVEIPIGLASLCRYSPGKRYVLASDITFDLLASFYDTNSRSALIMRLSAPLRPFDMERARQIILGMKRRNLEIRLIGLQDDDKILMHSIKEMKSLSDGRLAEVDLFGDQVRHLALDMLTGKPYSLLLENRIYRPGELNNTRTDVDFQNSRSELHFA